METELLKFRPVEFNPKVGDTVLVDKGLMGDRPPWWRPFARHRWDILPEKVPFVVSSCSADSALPGQSGQ